MIVVTAPTGNIGDHVVDDLIASNEPLRLIVREASKLPDSVRDRVEVVEGSHGDTAIVDRAFEGADALFWLAPPEPSRTLEQAYQDFTRPAVEGIRRLAVTALGRGTAWQHKAGLVTASIRMDDMIMTIGVAFRGLAIPSFMDNILRQATTIKEQGMSFGPIDAERKVPTTATRDISAVAAKLLVDHSWTGQEEVPVLGPEDLSFNDIAAIVSDVLGKRVRYQRMSFEAFERQLSGREMSRSFVQGYLEMMRAKNEGMDNVAERTAGTGTPTTFRQWCEEELKPAITG